jgi:hypothetical protein
MTAVPDSTNELCPDCRKNATLRYETCLVCATCGWVGDWIETTQLPTVADLEAIIDHIDTTADDLQTTIGCANVAADILRDAIHRRGAERALLRTDRVLLRDALAALLKRYDELARAFTACDDLRADANPAREALERTRP